MNKRVRINFRELSKEVTVEVSVEYDGPSSLISNEEVLEEVVSLFKAGMGKAQLLTRDKVLLRKG